MRYLLCTVLFCFVSIVHAQPDSFCRQAAHYAQMSIFAVRYGTPKLVWKLSNADVYKCAESRDVCERRTMFLDAALDASYSPEVMDKMDMIDDSNIQRFATQVNETMYRKCLRLTSPR